MRNKRQSEEPDAHLGRDGAMTRVAELKPLADANNRKWHWMRR